MYIRSSGKPTKVSLKLCKDALKFYGKRLLGENLYHKMNIKLAFEQFDKKQKEYAFCEWEYENHRAKDYIITLNKDLSKKEMLLAIAHEMVHVKQYAKGELKDYLKVNKCKWKGEVIDSDLVDYWDHPWEIEAHGREKGLYVKFMESLKKVK
jgi:hypothetical protein